jgi:hypothetical protein
MSKNAFKHTNHDNKKRLNVLDNFINGSKNFYDIFKEELSHTNFFYDENGLRSGKNTDDIFDKQEYNLNSLGYRCRDFSDSLPSNTLIFGCSTSFGQGVPEDQTWSNQLSKLKNIEILNLSIPGKGAARYFEDLLIYCNKYGKPKNVIVLLPDLYRLRFLNDIDYHIANNNDYIPKGVDMVPLFIEDIFLNNWNVYDRDKYLKVPFNSKDNISPYYGIYQNISSMYEIETFCRFAKINLFWSTYNSESKLIINELLKNKNIFNDFIIDDDLLTDEPALDANCKESHGNKHFNTDLWVFGTDKPWQGRKHPGVHLHTHVAEFFDRHLGVDDEGNLYKI